ncbi:MAG: VWA domain-containing protein [Gemmatimonadetes bacterium]|nr:VWA domain-containing protein [Gemmatimonadota bacterium]
MSFARPDLLWLSGALPIVIGMAVYGYLRRWRRALAALGEPELVRRLGAGDPDRHFARRVVLLSLAAAALGMALAGPRWGTDTIETRSRSLNLVLVLDASKSMLARDLEPSRLERERLIARRLLRELRGDRIGLVVFAGRAYVLAPLTVDHGALELYLDALDPEIVSQGGSSLSAALRQATDLARGVGQAAGARAVVLLSDGEALEDEAAVTAAAARALEAGVVIHTVGIGTPRGAPVPERDPETDQVLGYKREPNGEIVISRLNEPLLRRIAQRTGGRYERLDRAGASGRLLTTLRQMERTPYRGGRRVEERERFGWFVAFALALLALDVVWTRRAAPAPAVAGEA